MFLIISSGEGHIHASCLIVFNPWVVFNFFGMLMLTELHVRTWVGFSNKVMGHFQLHSNMSFTQQIIFLHWNADIFLLFLSFFPVLFTSDFWPLIWAGSGCLSKRNLFCHLACTSCTCGNYQKVMTICESWNIDRLIDMISPSNSFLFTSTAWCSAHITSDAAANFLPITRFIVMKLVIKTSFCWLNECLTQPHTHTGIVCTYFWRCHNESQHL